MYTHARMQARGPRGRPPDQQGERPVDGEGLPYMNYRIDRNIYVLGRGEGLNGGNKCHNPDFLGFSKTHGNGFWI